MISYSWAMMAAWFEGEGCIIIDQRQNAPTVVISASCTDEDVIKMIHAAFGNLSQHSVTSTGKLVWQWRMTGWRAAEFIERIRPFLGARVPRRPTRRSPGGPVVKQRSLNDGGGASTATCWKATTSSSIATSGSAGSVELSGTRDNRKQAEKKRAARQAAFGE